LREHVTGNEILAHRHDGVGLEAVILRLRSVDSAAPATIERSVFIAAFFLCDVLGMFVEVQIHVSAMCLF
jgi:hypothetical protein